MPGDVTDAHAADVSPDNVLSIESRFDPENPKSTPSGLTCLEICAGAGGQSLGLEQAGFAPVAVLEIDPDACQTLRGNRPRWNVVEGDIHEFEGAEFKGVDLLAGGPPCPPFSISRQATRRRRRA